MGRGWGQGTLNTFSAPLPECGGILCRSPRVCKEKVFYKALGFLFLTLALAGVFLPLLPTTPLVLVAAACFARSSPKWHQWLLSNRSFGPMIRRWEEQRCVSRRVKVVALVSMFGVGGFSVFRLVHEPALQIAGLALIAAGALVVVCIPTCPPGTRRDPD
ncbi:MAG: YbaN family protein [Burkholderiaceae bacterium]|nr:YbaN family protein [Burkholderiaceae bacterium]